MKHIKFLLLFLVILFVPANAQSFKFAVWGDSQFQNPATFENFVRETILLEPEFVLHTGDMIHGYTYNIDNARRQWKRFKSQIAGLKVPFYPTPGNHDVTTKEIQPAYLEAWGKDKLYYSFDHKGSHFIVLNAFLNQVHDTIPPVELDWLKQDLKKAKNAKNIFITMHSPLYLAKKSKFEAFHNIIKNYPVRGVFTGHYHIYDYRVIDGIPYFCINSSGNMNIYNHLAGRSHHFLYVSVDGSKVDYAVIAKDKIYAKDDVSPEELDHMGKFFDTDKSMLIPDPAKGGFTEKVRFDLRNRSDSIRIYTLAWNTADYRWKFEPQGANITLNPGEMVPVEFTITAPQGNFNREELPYMEITAPYTTLTGQNTRSSYLCRLFFPPVTEAVKISEQVNIDGNPDEAAWSRTGGIKNFYSDTRNTPAKEKTSVKMLYDDKYLYVAIRGEEPNPAGLSQIAYGDIPLVFGDDDFEIYFDNDQLPDTFFRLMVNPKGTVLNSSPSGLFTIKFDVKTHIGKDFWSAEFRIPFSELKSQTPSAGTKWRFNARRHRQQADLVQSDWSKMNPLPPYQPEYFGVLEFK